MRLEALKLAAEGLLSLTRRDPQAAICLLDWARAFVGREAEREQARRERRKPVLEAIELKKCQRVYGVGK